MSLEKKQIPAISFLSLTRSVVPALLVFWIIGSAQALDSFEEDVSGWHADGGNVQRSEEHWKLGKSSLRWHSAPGAVLTRARDATQDKALKSSDGGIKLWLYCPKRISGALQVQVGPWVFPVKLGFSGWRAVWVHFRDDARQATAPIDGLQISAPDITATLFIDAVELGHGPWFRQGDAQTPYTNPNRAGGKYWFTPHDHSLVSPPAPKRRLTADDTRAFREIERRYEEWMFGHWDDPRAPVRQRAEAVKSYIAQGHEAFDHLAVVRHDNVVSGPGVFCSMDEHGPYLGLDVFQPIALPLAYDARLNDSDRARRRFLDLLDYARDQGWAPGSLMGSDYAVPLGISGYVHGVYIMRQFLKERGALDRELETLRYHLGVGEIYRVPDHPGANADDLRTLLLYRLLYVLMLEDSPEKVHDMECFVRWANIALSVAPGYEDGIKPDGTVFHHATAYANAYGNNALLMSSLVYRLLSGTRFALSPQVGENIKQALLTQRFMAGQYEFPMGVSGRWPFLVNHKPMVETAPALAYMADALNDKQLGAAFTRLWNPEIPAIRRSFASCQAGIYWCDSPGSLPWLLDAVAKYAPEPHPQGHRAYPFAAMNFHRRRQWVASVRGWSEYVWNYEDMPGQNLFGRYSSYGTVQVFGRGDPVGREESGYSEEGWDWLRPPGATVIRVELDELRDSKVPARSYTRDSFVGGVALEGDNGLWAMRFQDPSYEPSFRFRKSAFFVDETVFCLGSGITNSDAKHATETVLYQTALTSVSEPRAQRESVQTQSLMDPVGNGYFFPEPQIVKVQSDRQHSIDNGGHRKTEGDFAVAWFDHGRAPRYAGYAYAIRPDTTAEDLQAFARAPDFRILKRDDSAHIVSFPAKNIVGYSLFNATEGLNFDSLSGASAPCLVMTRRDGDRLILAVADPDLRLGNRLPRKDNTSEAYTPGGEGRLRLQFNGAWNIDTAPPYVRAVDGHTLEIVCRDGATYEIVLTRQQ